jgi:hypothetical protein
MTGKADWVLIMVGAPPGAGRIDPTTGQPLPPGAPDPQGPPGIGGEPPPQPVGPIRGVRSRASGEAFHVFLDQSSYSSWEFRSDIFSRFRTAPSENGIPRQSALTLGRPFRYSIGGPGQDPNAPKTRALPPGGPGMPQTGFPETRPKSGAPPLNDRN